ncbi:MAG TPA: hypothetical protein VM345_15400 [Acidimicrobiales bacterium]|nr:hypothetical protein [Acidimicrobiales bacterium]
MRRLTHLSRIARCGARVDSSLATALQRVRMRATVMGQDRSGTFVISEVWRVVGGQWRLWRRHSTPFSAGSLD